MWSFPELQFYTSLLTTGKLLLISSNFFDVHFLYQQYINSVTTSCLETQDIATCKWSTLLALKMFKGNKKTGNILGLRLTQRTKGHVVEAVAQSCEISEKSAVKYFAKFTGKRLCRRLFKNEFIGSRLAMLLKKRLLDLCFLVNFLKLFGTVFYRTPENGYSCFI